MLGLRMFQNLAASCAELPSCFLSFSELFASPLRITSRSRREVFLIQNWLWIPGVALIAIALPLLSQTDVRLPNGGNGLPGGLLL
jgi:hypothetical protein